MFSKTRKLTREISTYFPNLEYEHVKSNLRINPKKAHEIANLSKVIHSVCEEHNIQIIVDIGSGLVSCENIKNIYVYHLLLSGLPITRLA